MHMTRERGSRALSLTVTFLLVGAPLLLIISGPAMAQDNVLSVTRTQELMTIDGVADEASWADAIVASIETKKGTDVVTVEVKALYDENDIYFLAKWSDPSKSVKPQQWQFTGDVWDSAPHKEDRLAILWNTEDNIVGFENNKQGCTAACHNDAFETQTADEAGDLWQWLSGRTNPSTKVPDVGWMDDLALKMTGVVPDDFTGSKVWEANSVYAHDTNGSTVPFSSGDEPKWMEGDNPPNPDPEDLFLFRGYERDFDPDAFVDGDHVPGYLLSKPATGLDRADISAKGVYDDDANTWTLEFMRALDTGNDGDVSFADLLNPFSFGLAVFDNKGGGKDTHYRSELVTLRFDVPELNLLAAEPSLTSPIVGGDINISVHVKNTAGYSTGFDVALYVDNLTSTPVDTEPFDEMNPSAESEFNFTLDTTGMAVGKHSVFVKVDADDRIPEHNEGNNIIEVEIWVYPPIVEFKASKKKPEEGQKVKLTATIDNPTDADANITVIFYKSGTVLDTMFVNISARDQGNVVYEWKAKKTGKHVFGVEIQGAVNTLTNITVDVKEESPGPSAIMAVLAISLVTGLAVTRRRRN
jgi:hypothetical protein